MDNVEKRLLNAASIMFFLIILAILVGVFAIVWDSPPLAWAGFIVFLLLWYEGFYKHRDQFSALEEKTRDKKP